MEYVFTPLKSEQLSERKFECVMHVYVTGVETRVKNSIHDLHGNDDSSMNWSPVAVFYHSGERVK